MNYAKLAVLGLQVVLWLMDRAKADRQMEAGRDVEIARSAQVILRQTDTGKRIMERLDAMAPAERDDLTDALGTAGQG